MRELPPALTGVSLLKGDSLPYRTRTVQPSGPPATYGSRTVTLHPEEIQEQDHDRVSGVDSEGPVVAGTLKLKGGSSRDRKVKWDENVVDNEGMGKKKSKICCIYHKPRAFDESSDDSSSSDSDDKSGGDSDSGKHSDENGCSRGRHRHRRRHNHGQDVSPNAYERQPHYKDHTQPPPMSPSDNPTTPSS